MCNRVKRAMVVAGSVIVSCQRGVTAALVAVGAALLGASAANATTTTIPDVGVDFPGLVTAATTSLGAVVTAIVLAYFAFLVVRFGMKWARKIA